LQETIKSRDLEEDSREDAEEALASLLAVANRPTFKKQSSQKPNGESPLEKSRNVNSFKMKGMTSLSQINN